MEDYGKYELFNLSFSGVVPKVCCKKDNKLFIIKSDNVGEYKCLSEYLSSKIAEVLEIDCQKVSIGFRDGLLSCGIELFNNGSDLIHHYYDVNDSSLSSLDVDVRELPYTLDLILQVLSNYKSIDIDSKDIISNFVTMCLFDCLIGNYDRHWGNWGFIGKHKHYSICPLFDNGSSLYPKLTLDEISNIISDKREFYKAIYEFPKSQIRRTKKKKFLYKDLMEKLLCLGFDKEFEEFVFKFESNKKAIESIFDDSDLLEIIEKPRLDFLKAMLFSRFKLLIKDVVECN